MQLINLIQNANNPMQMIMNLMPSKGTNPMADNLSNMIQNNDTKGIEQFARNVMKEQGKDFDKEFANFKKTFGIH